MNKGTLSSSESGIGEGEGDGSAVEDFFNNFVPQLNSFAQQHDEILEDPTIDLDDMAICQSVRPSSNQVVQRHVEQRQQQLHRQIMITDHRNGNNDNAGRDLSMDEIGLIVGQLKTGGPYSEKLSTIMLKGLEQTLTKNFYKLFIEFGLPENWCPIVKMNNDNTPFVEFLIKSDLSDQDPFSQLNEYSTEHMALCKFVVDKLHQNANRNNQQLVPVSRATKLRSQPRAHSCGPLACSTPRSQRQRVLPPRACKSQKK